MNPESENSPDTLPTLSSASLPPGIPPTALAWGTVRRATSDDLPDAYDGRVHLEAIYVLTRANSDTLVTHPPCHHCRKGRKFCDRGYPTCSLCARNGLKCARQDSGWADLPLYKIKKNADKNDNGVKRKRLAADEAEPSDMKINPRQKQAKTDAPTSEVLTDNDTERPFTRSHTTLTERSRIETAQAALKPDGKAPAEKETKSKSKYSKGDSKKHTARLLSSSKAALPIQKKSKKLRESGSILEEPPHMASTMDNKRVKSHSKTNYTWRTAKPTPILPVPLRSLLNGRPRIWTGTYRELSVAIPALEKPTDGIVSEGCDTPILIFNSNRDKVPELGAWEGDTWEGRRITFSIARDILVPPTLGNSGLISNDLDAAHPCSSGSSMDLSLIPSSSASLNAEGAPIISRKPESGNVASEASHPSSCDVKLSQDVDQLGRVSSDPQVNLVVRAASTTPDPDYKDVSLRPQTYSPCNCTRVSFDPDCPDCNGSIAPTSLSYPVADQDIEMSIDSAHKDDPQDGRDNVRNSIHSNIDDNEMVNSVVNPGAHVDAGSQSTGANVLPSSVPSHSGISSSVPSIVPLPASAAPQLYNATLTTSFPVESIPSPPTDIQALLHAHETGRPVSIIVSRDAPLMPWILPDEVGYVWAGLFAVVRMKEDKLYAPSSRVTSTTTLRVLWRFELEWICGGEESLKSEAQDFKEWQKTIQRPWWECTSSPSETALDSPMAIDAPLTQNTVATEQDSDPINPTALDRSSPRRPFDAPITHSLIPLPLLASFSASSANDAFPSGYFCRNCGRVNIQRFLRHRACESAHCSVLRSRATMDQSVGGDSIESGVKEIRDDGQGWMMDIMAVRNPRLTYVCLFPDNMCLEPAVSLLRQDWGDGMRVFWYGLPSLSSLSQHTSLDRQVPPTPPVPAAPVSNLAPVTSEQVLHSDKPLVRHIFTGNLPRLQTEPTDLFGRLQRDIQLERRYGETVFTKRFDSSAIVEGEGGTVVPKSITKLQEFMEYLVSTYGEERAIKMPAIEILSWVGEGKARDVFHAKDKSLAVLCLGADVAFTFTYSDHNSKGTAAVPTKVPAKAPSVNPRNHDATSDTQDLGTKKKAKNPAVLRITLLHGDMMVLSGGDFEYSMARTRMCILAIGSYVPGSRSTLSLAGAQ